MRIERRALTPPAALAAADLRGPGNRGMAVSAGVEDAVRDIVARVRRDGEQAVLDLTRELDTAGAEPLPLRVEPAEAAQALEDLDADLREALEVAAANVRAVAEMQLVGEREAILPQGQRVVLREVPVRRAGVYVPGGRAPYPSTAVMGAVTARAAGVEQVVVCAPPARDGSAQPEILAACALCGVTEVYRMGGAQAVAALAIGVPGIAPVDVIVGPGNEYVQEAKRQLSHRVGIDSFAGPSELLVIADSTADAGLIALDLLAQAEHGPSTRVVAVSPSASLLDALTRELERRGLQASSGDDCLLVEVEDMQEALALANAYAPEHLQLIGADAEALAPEVGCAGCLFVGPQSGTAFGDYVAGSNHVLPTGGAARFASVLSPRTFSRQMAEVRIEGAAAMLAQPGSVIARAEGFPLHAESMEARMHHNDRDG